MVEAAYAAKLSKDGEHRDVYSRAFPSPVDWRDSLLRF
jgi:hypothetical protein